MKKLFSSSGLLASLFAMPLFAASQNNSTSLESLIIKYYDVKNALVNSDATGTAKAAGEFVVFVQSINAASLQPRERNAFSTGKDKLVASAKAIAATKDLSKQRGEFQQLSANIMSLGKTAKLAEPSYIAYCPMKKAYWLSAEKEIKNPYYGASMLNCGSVKETIKN